MATDREIDATTPDGHDEAEANFLECAMDIPEGYTRCGIAWTNYGPRLFVAGPGVPAMFWKDTQEGWVMIVQRTTQ